MITACLVVYNEEKIIGRCLESIRGVADEIIVVHDGECTDATLKIAAEFTDKIFVREHVGMMEAHVVFAYEHAKSDWILRIDADEYLDPAEFTAIRALTERTDIAGARFQWEMWDGERVVYFAGLKKTCLFKKDAISFVAVPHADAVPLALPTVDTTLHLHHRPLQGNASWAPFLKKVKLWTPVHAAYFFKEASDIPSFHTTADSWITFARTVRKHPFVSMLWLPCKMFLGQLKNNLWKSRYGWFVCAEQYVYYLFLYYHVWIRSRR